MHDCFNYPDDLRIRPCEVYRVYTNWCENIKNPETEPDRELKSQKNIVKYTLENFPQADMSYELKDIHYRT